MSWHETAESAVEEEEMFSLTQTLLLPPTPPQDTGDLHTGLCVGSCHSSTIAFTTELRHYDQEVFSTNILICESWKPRICLSKRLQIRVDVKRSLCRAFKSVLWHRACYITCFSTFQHFVKNVFTVPFWVRKDWIIVLYLKEQRQRLFPAVIVLFTMLLTWLCSSPHQS